jgi:4-alpha-glucanotransferase/glycosidase
MDHEWLLHDSHNLFFRSPFGAVSCRTPITLRLAVRSPDRPDGAGVSLWRDGRGAEDIPMALWREEGDNRIYQAELAAPAAPGPLWYSFRLTRHGRTIHYGNNPARLGGRGQVYDHDPAAWQITVHSPGAKTPDWLKDAVIYQIFVDRFYNGNPDGAIVNPPPASLLHPYWDAIPFYVRDTRTGAIFAYDFFGGNLKGVLAKLPYLKDLGVTALYFNPVFESPSNHKYDTGDYKAIDPMFGDNALFAELCARAGDLGLNIILDGVFSHTGSDSRYFNRDGRYPEPGAYQSRESPYYPWYRFSHWPDHYESWWGIGTLPNVNELEPSYVDFIIQGPDSVVRHWARAGVKGWRLDVADELPDEFIRRFRAVLKQEDPDAVLIGEVWEDASNKESYGARREYLWGDGLDAATGYPFRAILLDFALGRRNAEAVHAALTSLCENYPRENFYAAMNLLGSHDVPRILTLLGEAPAPDKMSISDQARYRLPADRRRLGISRLKLLALCQLTFPGAPCIYYGDEAGLEGYADPFNRGTYPWGAEDGELLAWYRKLTALRRRHAVLRGGEWLPLHARGDVYGYVRRIGRGRDVFGRPERSNAALVLLNRAREPVRLTLDVGEHVDGEGYNALAGYQPVPVRDGRLEIILGPLSGALLLKRREDPPAFSRAAGVLLHPASLPGGDLGPSAYAFVDWLAAAGQKWWQILPLNPPGLGGSPYQSVSAFAGDPGLISPDIAVDEAGYPAFLAENALWLDNYATYAALKDHYGGRPWTEWEDGEAALAGGRIAGEVERRRREQYVFFRQWQALKDYANAKGIKIIGDLPIFVAADSADVWANRRLFRLDAAGRPLAVAGVPPDYFSATGQLWGNPLYDWDAMAADGYRWWRERLAQATRLADAVRIDHFRGFEAFWAVPAGEPTAERGRWEKGPGAPFFAAMEQHLGRLPVIAEDLGVITPAVESLRDKFAYPGMKILQFALESGDWPDGEDNAVVYTGTHDNDTILGWHRKRTGDDGADGAAGWRYIETAYGAAACLAVIPLQDILGLGSEARLNTPGTVSAANWSWRFQEGDITPETAADLAALAAKYGR